MKQIITLAFFAIILLLNACTTEADSKAVRNEILNIHDKLMMDGEKVIRNRIKLDSVLKSDTIKAINDSVKIADLVGRLNAADEKMMDWMHLFKKDFKGKNEQENLEYYKSEMIRIRDVEDSYIKVTRESDSVLKVYKIVPDEKMKMQHHQH